MNWIDKKTIKISLTLMILILVISSCSTKKKNFVSRKYHGVTAKYNGYFNGNESIKAGIKKLEEDCKDDFSGIIPVFKTGDLIKNQTIHPYMNKAIKKGSIVIQNHSINIKGKEYNKWIDDNYFMIGKAYFYKGEFNEAITTFNYIKENFKRNPIRYNASLWLARCYLEKEDYTVAEMELDKSQSDRKFPEKLDTELALILADFYLKKDNYILALDELNTAIKLIKRNKKKTRYHFILAQLNQQHQNYNKAISYYDKVIKVNPKYEMVFNSKINKAQCFQENSEYSKKVEEELLKMTKDDKNKEYLDQIYYVIAKMNLSQKDTVSAINNFTLSTEKSKYNDDQKSKSFLDLGRIFYLKSNYLSASEFYDSTITFMDSNHKEYNQVKEKQVLLAKLAMYLNTITLEDSLQRLAKMSEAELNKTINEIIIAEQKKELEKQELARQKSQHMFENNRYGERENNFGQKTSGGKWYFYNPATLSFGHSEFIKKWGKRKNEDNWRRIDKKISIEMERDSTTLNQENVEKESITNKKDPKYYKDRVPLTKEKLEESNLNIIEAYFQASLIYKDYLNENNKAINMLSSIIKKYPKNKSHCPIAHYNLYKMYFENNKPKKAEECKKMLLKNFPESKYSKLLYQPDYLTNIEQKRKYQKEYYKKTLNLYNNKEYFAVIFQCDSVNPELHDPDLKSRYDYLKALATNKIRDTISFKRQLNEIIKNYPETEIEKRAKEILTLLNNPSKIEKIHKEIESVTPYIFDENETHYFILLMPKTNTDVNYIKTLLSDYHINKFSIETFEISATLFGKNKHLIMIKDFHGSKKAKEYFNSFNTAIKVNNELLKTESKKLLISAQNFQYFFKNSDLKGYYDFFRNNYLNELTN